MAPATLAHLDAVPLLDRVDTKFLLSESQLEAILPSLERDYLVLEIRGRRLHRYRTLYFDTPDFELYRRHHDGQALRYKVRSRAYVDTGLSFFEIKSKHGRRRTLKHRLATPRFLASLSADARAFVARHVPSESRALQPTLQNAFIRATLVGKHCPERLTLDLGLRFDRGGRTVVLPKVVVAELKQGDDRSSPFLRRMRIVGIRPAGLSKYCVGVGLLVAGIERDAFAGQLRAIESLSDGGSDSPTMRRVELGAVRKVSTPTSGQGSRRRVVAGRGHTAPGRAIPRCMAGETPVSCYS